MKPQVYGGKRQLEDLLEAMFVPEQAVQVNDSDKGQFLEEALSAFGTDYRYAEQMARSAVRIEQRDATRMTRVQIPGHRVTIQSQDRHLMDGYSWRVHENRSGGLAVVASTGPRGKSALALHTLVWQAMGNTGSVTHRDGNGLNCTRQNLAAAHQRGRLPGTPAGNPSPSELGIHRHKRDGHNPPRSYDLCTGPVTVYLAGPRCLERKLAGVAYRVRGGWQIQPQDSPERSEVFSRFYDACQWLASQVTQDA